MGITERIGQMLEAQSRKAAEELKIKQEAEEKRLKVTEERNLFLSSQKEKLLRETGIVPLLQQIENDLLENSSRNHRTFQHSSEDKHFIYLAWDYDKQQETNNGISGENFKSIDIEINLSNESITIGNKTVQKLQWRKKNDLIEELLAEAFLSPRTHITEPFEGWGPYS
ncbi:MAG: hypothetical protein WCW14_04050 [Candidatus Paceibacterota bacterium]